MRADEYQIIYNSRGTEYAVRTGGTRLCPLAGCTGLRIYVRWPDNRVTYPCTKGLVRRPDGAYQIGAR
jgi:hypothetical protein